jgi:hypothetical protein
MTPTMAMANTLKKQRQRRNDKDFTTKNIATGETSPAITPYHFLGNFNFSNFHHKITFITSSIARVTSVKFSIGIITHQGHISQVSATA